MSGYLFLVLPMKKVLSLAFVSGFVLSVFTPVVFAVENNFEIIPESKTNVSTDVEEVGKAGGHVRDTLNQKAKKYEGSGDVGAQFASGAFTWNTILNYVVYLVRFISQIALVIGAFMIIRAGYKYAAAAFTGKPAGSEDIKNAIIGILIVVFSYAIIKILTEAFL